MKGDFSRSTFRPQKHYRAVFMQQGRVLLDADWNEMIEIVNSQQTLALRNLIGAHGGLGDGFQVTFAEKTSAWTGENGTFPGIFINAGQYYANGYSCTLEESVCFEAQPYFPGAEKHKNALLRNEDSNQWLLYLDVWERHLTAIEDPDLFELSLGGADTTTRSQIVWQVKMLPVKDQEIDSKKAAELSDGQSLNNSQHPAIEVKTGHATENELFRIEIHSGGELSKDQDASETHHRGRKPPTWKWSRDNASLAFPLDDIRHPENGSRKKRSHSLQLTLAAHQRLQEQLRPGDCVELECDAWILNGSPTWIGRIDQMEASDKNGLQRLMITVSRHVTSADLALLQDQSQHPLVRRWDQKALKTEGNFHVYKIDKNSINRQSQSLVEILLPARKPAVHPGDRVEFSGFTEGASWLEGQVQQVSTEGDCQKITVTLEEPLPDEGTIEKPGQPVQMRRWTDQANFYLVEIDKNKIRPDKNRPSLVELLLPPEQAFLDPGDLVELSGLTEGASWLVGQVQEVSTERKDQKIKVTLDHTLPDEMALEKIKQPVQVRWWNDGTDFYLYPLDKNSINQQSRSLIEMLIPERQPAVYREDRVELSGIAADRMWLEGQVQEVSREGECQKITVALDEPLPDERTIEKTGQPVQMRRWNEEVNLVIPNKRQSLEHAITVRFPPGSYQTGDYWLMPIRGMGATKPEFTVPRANTVHACVPLAFLTRRDAQWELKDFRRPFLDLGNVFASLQCAFASVESLQAELERTKEKLAALQEETDIEDEEQEAEISMLESETDRVSGNLSQLHESVETLESKIGGYISRFLVPAWMIPLVLGIGLLFAYLIFAQGNQSQFSAASQQATADAMQTAIAQQASALRQANQKTTAQEAAASLIQQANQTAIAQNEVAVQRANQTAVAQQADINSIRTAIPTPRLYIALNPTSTNTLTVVTGNGSGTAFTKSCPPNFVATGLYVKTGSYVNAIQLWCSPLFEDSTIGRRSAVESYLGGQDGTEAQLACQPSMVIAGISGRSGQWTDRLQVHCAALDGAQKQDLQEVGGTGGSAFPQKKCPDNFVMTGITGRADDNYVIQLNMVCTEYVTK